MSLFGARYVDDQLYCLRTKWTSDLESFEPYRAPFDLSLIHI